MKNPDLVESSILMKPVRTGWVGKLSLVRVEVGVVAKALVRLLRSHYEVQAIVLNSIAAMTIQATGQNSSY